MKLLTVLTLALTLTGCALRGGPVESAYASQEESTLSGSPCLDGLFVNLEERCMIPVASASTYGDYVEVACSVPLPPQPGDLVYEGYTSLTFRVYDNDNMEYIPDEGLAYFCQDTVVTVGFEIPTE